MKMAKADKQDIDAAGDLLVILNDLSGGHYPVLGEPDDDTPVLTDVEIAKALSDAGATDYAEIPLRYDLEIARIVERTAIEAYQRQQWRPIETAPKDGQHVLVRLTDGTHCIGVMSDLVGLQLPPWHRRSTPTHWMPLPPFPDLPTPTVDNPLENSMTDLRQTDHADVSKTLGKE